MLSLKSILFGIHEDGSLLPNVNITFTLFIIHSGDPDLSKKDVAVRRRSAPKLSEQKTPH